MIKLPYHLGCPTSDPKDLGKPAEPAHQMVLESKGDYLHRARTA